VLFWLARAHAREGGQAPSTALRFRPAAIPGPPTREHDRPQGPDAIFSSADVEDLIAVIEGVRANATPQDAAA